MKVIKCITLSVFAGVCALVSALTLANPTASAQSPVNVEHSAHIIPETFVRRWDPVTIFFNHTPAARADKTAGEVEHQPEQWVSMSPKHPGVFTWLNANTLQFKPIEPWPALRDTTWTLTHSAQRAEKTHTLTTLMRKPSRIDPANNSEQLKAFSHVTLSFSEPINPDDLADMLHFEVSDLPGVDDKKSKRLDKTYFKIKAVERQSNQEDARYIVRLHESIGASKKIKLHIQLASDAHPNLSQETVQTYHFQTQPAFELKALGCGYHQYPILPEGVMYPQAQAIHCGGYDRFIQLSFNAYLQTIQMPQLRNLVRISPQVEHLEINQSGDEIYLYGDFRSDTLYQINIKANALNDIKDDQARPLSLSADSELFIHFPAKTRYLDWQSGDFSSNSGSVRGGIMETFGPKMLPLVGRGHEQVDMRIYSVDPLDRNFWPFEHTEILVDESTQPPSPGEAPAAIRPDQSGLNVQSLKQHIKALGSPPISDIVALDLPKGSHARFGLDIEDSLEKLSGKHKSGSYLVGIRSLSEDNGHKASKRSWVRIQVTDLSLAVFEHTREGKVTLLITSLNTGKPIDNATIKLEGTLARSNNKASHWQTLVDVRTDDRGMAEFDLNDIAYKSTIKRISVQKGEDVLVMNPKFAPQTFKDGYYSTTHSWLSWLKYKQTNAHHQDGKFVCHLYSERPVYKPEDAVHLNGYFRFYNHHNARLEKRDISGHLVIEGPGLREWRFPIHDKSDHANTRGSFYQLFEEADLPSGHYRAFYELKDGKKSYGRCGQMSFQKEAYKVPKFEVQLHTQTDNADASVALDKPFSIKAVADYYAGGQVVNQKIQWRVTQMPYTWAPNTAAFKAFSFSSDSRFSGRTAFRSGSVISKTDKTDTTGAATLTIDPTIERSAQPRTYIVEATVTDIDNQPVSNTKKINALPPMVLGLNVPRVIKHPGTIKGELVALDHQGDWLVDQEIQVTFKKRTWQSHLQATDYSQGNAKYVTQTQDHILWQKTVMSQAEALELLLEAKRSGVYILQIQSQDALGRSQFMELDFFVGGEQPVTWSKPASPVFTVTSDKTTYLPNETAKLVLESPYQTAFAMAIVETNRGFDYTPIDIVGGKATFEFTVKSEFMPRLPVHFMLWRGRNHAVAANQNLDLGKPATLAATTWVNVEPIQHKIGVKLTHKKALLPSEEFTLDIELTDHNGDPMAGEVTLWAVDQAVLSLGKEQRLSILNDFIVYRDSHFQFSDTRNLGYGFIPFDSIPGGGEGSREKATLADKVTVRKNFKEVAFYKTVTVEASGKLSVSVQMPDNLTVFKLRAKVVSGDDKFGIAKSDVQVRLPVLVQPALPRFLRFGDTFHAGVVARVIDKTAGAANVSLTVSNAESEPLNADERAIELSALTPNLSQFSIKVPSQTAGNTPNTLQFQGQVIRQSDGAADAFLVDIPVLADREATVHSELFELTQGNDYSLPVLDTPVRDGSFEQSITISNQPALLKMNAALSYLLQYPHGCTEQRLSKASALLSMQGLLNTTHTEADRSALIQAVNEANVWLSGVESDNGLISFWPGAEGYVFLSAMALDFLFDAEAAGFNINVSLKHSLISTLKKSLRRDYPAFIAGESYTERTMALLALAKVGQLDKSYLAELSRNAQFMNTDARALLVQVMEENTPGFDTALNALWNDMVFSLQEGVEREAQEVWSGFQQSQQDTRNRLILPFGSQTLANTLTAVLGVNAQNGRQHPRVQSLADGLVNLANKDGWGSTRANAAAIDALTQFLSTQSGNVHTANIDIVAGSGTHTATLNNEKKLMHWRSQISESVRVKTEASAPLLLKSERRYLPVAKGSVSQANAQGFVIERAWLEVSNAMKKVPLNIAGQQIELKQGDIIEEHIQLINPTDRHHVAVVVPLAAGMEPMNPNLAISAKAAKPAGQLTLSPSYADYQDDQVRFYYDVLPKGNYDFYFRTRASTQGHFTQPPARVEMMYDDTVRANSSGASIVVQSF